MNKVSILIMVYGKNGFNLSFCDTVEYDNTELTVGELKKLVFQKQNTFETIKTNVIERDHNCVEKQVVSKTTTVTPDCFRVKENKYPWREFSDDAKVSELGNDLRFLNLRDNLIPILPENVNLLKKSYF